MFHTIFQQPDADAVWKQAREVVAFCQEKFPQVADYLEEALHELLAFTNAPKAVWTKVWSNNPTERLNRRSAGVPTSSASSQTGTRWFVWSGRYSRSSMMTGFSRNAICR